MKQIVLATGNPGKVAEFEQLFAQHQMAFAPQSEYQVSEIAETGTTFVENAIIKARHAAQQTGLPAIADDSGLVVTALQGQPGIYSSRFAGDDATDDKNIDKLLAALDGQTNRRAHFYCCLVYMRHADDPVPIVCEGYWWGEIDSHRKGDGGFGYDPVFYLPSLGKSAAQLTKPEKSAISHRGQALKLLIERM